MENYFRRVYGYLVGLLIALWVGMIAWVSTEMTPSHYFFDGTKKSKVDLRDRIQDSASSIHVPGVRFHCHVASEGDTFLEIAKKYGLSENCLRSLNQANDESEPPQNTTLLIPSRDGIFHIVQSGQSLSDISKGYAMSLKEVLRANQISGDADLRPDKVLYLPGAPYLKRKDLRWRFLSALAKKKGFLKPTTGRFADGFGKRQHPLTGKLSFHEGLDLAPGWRARVVASQEGSVIFAAIRAGYGRLIILDHGEGLTSWYAHLDEILVKPKQRIKRGELIGKVGKSGSVTGPHLHFEVRSNGTPKNPFLYLAQ